MTKVQINKSTFRKPSAVSSLLELSASRAQSQACSSYAEAKESLQLCRGKGKSSTIQRFNIYILIPLVFCALVSPKAKAQIAGMNSFSVLDVSLAPRAAALGMDYLSVWDNDFELTIDNPSLIGHWVNHNVSLNFCSAFSKVNYGSLAYGVDFSKLGSFVFGFRFHNYGRFHGYDENEVPTGDFFAEDYLLSIGWGRAIDSNFFIGANFKPIYSHYEHYQSFAFSIDLAATFVSDSRLFAATLMGRNIGAQIVTFDGTTEKMPFELSANLSYKLQRAPFRFYLAANELQRWNLSYDDEINPNYSKDPFTGEVTYQSDVAAFFDNLARHFNVGVELTIQKVFFAQLGFSYRQTKEIQSFGSFNASGFSFGFGIRVKGFEFAYSRNNYHYGQAPNFFSLSTSLDRFFSKKKSLPASLQ